MLMRLKMCTPMLLFLLSLLSLFPSWTCFQTLTHQGASFLQSARRLGMSRPDAHSKEKIEKAGKLVDWLESNGGYVNPKCSVAYCQYGYELRANSLIKAGEVLCTVPREAQIYATGDMALYEISSIIAKEKTKGESSFYHPFLECLPMDVSYMPAMWGEDKLALIEGTTVYADAVAQRDSWIEDMDANGIDRSLIGELMWSRATTQCRTLSFPGGLFTFLPYISLANHNDEPDGMFQYPYPELGDGESLPTSTVLLRAKKEYSPGHEISINYGDMSFQQKCTSFGWIDHSINSESTCITTVVIGKRILEVKTSMEAAKKLKKGMKLGLQDTLGVKKQLRYVFSVMESEQMPKHELVNNLEKKIAILEELDAKVSQKMSDCDLIRQVELEAAQFILTVLLGLIQK